MREPVLANQVDDEQLAERAYSTLSEPLLPPNEAAFLRSEFDRIYGSQGSGWYNAFNDPEPGPRREADAVLAEHLHPALSKVFVGYEPFLSTYLVKWPGGEEHANFLYLHRDWMYIEETEIDRTFVVFLALQDITEHNGAVQVLPRGNNLDQMLRGTGIVAPWLSHGDVLRPRMVPLPMRIGEAAVWDGAIVHSSGPNRSAEPRVAVGVWLRPTGRQLVHYRRLDATTATRHLVDPDFFRRETSHSVDGTLSTDPDAVEVPIREVELNSEALAEVLALIEPGG